MALVLKDRVRETSTTSGTGTIVLSGAVSGFQTFAAIGNTNTTYYCIADSSTGGWEVGIGTYTASGTTLSRDTVLASSNSGSLVAFSSNIKDVFCTYPAEKSANTNAALTSGRVTYATTDGLLTDSANMTFNGTRLTVADLADSGLTSGRVVYASTGGSLVDSAALAFDGTSLLVGGAATLANASLVANQGVVARTAAASGTVPYLQMYNGNAGTNLKTWRIGGGATGQLTIETVNDAYSTATQRMVIDSSGNVGIGKSNPVSKLDIVGDVTATAQFIQTSAGTSTISYTFGGQTTKTGMGCPADGTLAFYAGTTTERMRIDSSGNVGIGTTTVNTRLTVFTSNANSTDGILVRGGATTSNVLIRPAMGAGANNGIVQAGDSGIIFDRNAENTGAFVIAPWASGTSGIRMDSSGQVGIGTSSPGARLDIVSASGLGTSLRVSHPGNTSFGTAIQVRTVSGTDDPVISLENFNGGSPVRYGISCTDNGSIAFLSGAYEVGFGTERMRLDSSGNLLVGTTTASARLTSATGSSSLSAGYFSTSGNTQCIIVNDQGANGAGISMATSGTNGNKYMRALGGNWELINAAYTSTIMVVTNAGVAYQGNNSSTWSVTSDIRIKTNVRQIGSALDKMMALKPCHFEYKNAVGETSTGFIAQEFEEVFPGHVKETPAPMQFQDYIEGDDKTLKTIDANLVPYLVKAIQELKAEFDAYKATHP